MKKFTCQLLLLLLLAGCQGREETVTVTPLIVPATTSTTATEGVTEGGNAPTIEATATTEATTSTGEVTEEATAVPSTEPAPTESSMAPVNQIQLLPIVASGLPRPTYLTHAFDQRLFVVGQDGTIHIVENGQVRQPPFLDIDDRVGSQASEQGLLSLAFHPQYATNGYFFVNYTDNNGDTVIARYQVRADDPAQADPASELRLLTIDQPFPNHNGGQLQFGPDGYLYIGMGDGGSGGDPQGHGQNPATLLGALLRLDVDVEESGANYGIPATNPFANDESARHEIWAIGLRNPWRFTFDRLTGDLYIADVGQNGWEEVSFQPANTSGGENYGWNIMEGNHCFRAETCNTEGLVLPIFEYDHNQGCSITGGYVYRGQAFPTLRGNYFLADYCSGTIWSLFHQPDGSWTAAVVNESGRRIASFGEDAAGELYALDHTGGVYQVQP